MKRMLLALLVITSVIIYITLRYSTVTVVYDCRMIEQHLDIPKEVREECRKLKIEEHKSRNYI